MMVAPDYIIAAEQIIDCISIIIFGFLWNKKSDRLFNYYPVFCILETVCGISTTAYAIITKNLVSYYILDAFVFAIVTRNICCGGVKLRALRYNSEEKREHYDNNNNSVASAATIIGSMIAMVLRLNLPIMLCLATFGNMIDNIFYIFIFRNVRKERQVFSNENGRTCE